MTIIRNKSKQMLVGFLVVSTMIFIACGGLNTTSSSKLAAETEYFKKHNMGPGSGVNTLSGDIGGACVEVTQLEDEDGAKSQETKYSLSIISSAADIAEDLEVNASGKVSGLWGNVSAKASLMQSTSIRDYSVSGLIYIRVTNETRRMKNVVLKKEFQKLFSSNPDKFYQLCGDSFVAGVSHGGEYFALVNQTTHSEEEEKELKASLKAKGFGVQINADAAHVKSESFKDMALEIVAEQKGGFGDTSEPARSVEEVIKRFKELPKIATENPWPFSASLQSYESLLVGLGNDDAIKNISKTRQQFAEHRFAHLAMLGQINSVQHVIDNPSEFKVGSQLDQYKSYMEKLTQTSKDFAKALIDCSEEYSCNFPTNKYEVKPMALPSYQPSKKTIPGYCGGTSNIVREVNFEPPHFGNGDLEFKKHGPTIFINGSLKVSSDKRQVFFSMFADFKETKKDWTQARGRKDFLVFDGVPANWEIESLTGTTTWPLIVQDVDTSNAVEKYSGPGVPGEFLVWGDTKGNDVENGTRILAKLRCKFKVNLKKKLD